MKSQMQTIQNFIKHCCLQLAIEHTESVFNVIPIAVKMIGNSKTFLNMNPMKILVIAGLKELPNDILSICLKLKWWQT